MSAADSVGLSSSFFCGGFRKTYLFCNGVRIGRSRSSKVVDFGTNRKGVCDVLLVINSNFGSLGVNPFEFLDELFIPKTKSPSAI